VVKHIGLTSHRLEVANEAVVSDCFETVMVALNFVNTEVADGLIPLAREHDVGILAMKPLAGGMLNNATIAFKYLLQFSDVLPLVGVAREGEMEEIIQIAKSAEPMSVAEQLEMKRIRAELGSGFCRMCGYCQPCPQGIVIPAVMYARVAATRFDPERIFRGEYNNYMEKVAECNECGECETKCPYNLPIRDKIVEESKIFFIERNKHLEQNPA
jgi:predicted aldo/keto reductase-like oxidoreductase